MARVILVIIPWLVMCYGVYWIGDQLANMRRMRWLMRPIGWLLSGMSMLIGLSLVAGVLSGGGNWLDMFIESFRASGR